MEYIWNNAELPMPALTIVPVKKIKFNLCELKQLLQRSIDFYECQINYNYNAMICSKLIARRKSSFRHFKGFQDMCKVYSTYRRLIKLNISNVLTNYIGLLPDSILTLELPPKVNLDYVLLRIIGYYKLLQRISDCCKNAVRYFMCLLRNNFFMDTLSLFLSVLSKIWYDGNIIAKFTARLYHDLKKYLPLMPKNKDKHDFDDFIYPEELDEDLENEFIKQEPSDQISEEQNTIKTKMYLKKKITKPVEASKQKISDLGEVIDRESYTNSIKSFQPKFVQCDLGVSIDREYLNNSIESNKTVSKSFKHKIDTKTSKGFLPPTNINNINTIDEIKKILKNEDLKRKSKINLFTKNLSDEQWLNIKKKIKEKIKEGEKKKARKIFRKVFHTKKELETNI